MGDFRVRQINNSADRRRMYQYAINDIIALEKMLDQQMFQNDPIRIGAEQELCIVQSDMSPATSALEILDQVKDEHYTNELALFNLEINLDPYLLENQCFSEMEQSLIGLLQKGKDIAAQKGEHLLMTGILPTLNYNHLEFDYMTPVPRYQILSKVLSNLRGSKFEIYLQGVDDLIMSLESVLFEACNTSFQLHLQIKPNEFVDKHNWSQMIAGPVLSACVNSPLVFGKELWAESRIAIFKQSMDTRSAQRYLRKKLPRVYFGDDWIHQSPAELWKKDLMRFPFLVTSDDFQDPQKTLDRGEIPDLRAIKLHNGTTYTWNRMIYGHGKKQPHLRIECRYIPSGPTAVDEIANFAFWVGLMNCEPPQGIDFWKKWSFKPTKDNFIKAARNGLNTTFDWFGKNIPANKLILDTLLPMAHQGLEKVNVKKTDIAKYLDIIEKRVTKGSTGADWTIQNFRHLNQKTNPATAKAELVKQMLTYQNENTPVHDWDYFKKDNHFIQFPSIKINQLMSTDVYSIDPDDSIEFAKKILEWNQIHHLPVEDVKGNLVGLVTDGMIRRLDPDALKKEIYIKDIMLQQLITISKNATVEEAITKMQTHQLNGLPVVYGPKLIGIITKKDLEQVDHFVASTVDEK